MARYHWFYGVASTCVVVGVAACWSLPDIVSPQPGGGGSTVGGGGNTTASPTPGMPTPVVSTTPSPIPRTTYLHQEGGVLKDATGANVLLRGISWFGFEYQEMLNLPTSPSRLGSDVVTVMQRLRLLGFNMVYLPFSFSQLYNLSTGLQLTAQSASSISCSGDSTLADILASVTISGLKNPNNNVSLLSNVPQLTPGFCNDYLPTSNHLVVERLAAVISIFTRNGFYVMLSEDVSKGSDSSLSMDASQFARWWKILASDLVTYGGAYENTPSAVCNSDPNNTTLALCHNLIFHLAQNSSSLNPNLTWEPNQQDNRPVGAHQLYVEAYQSLNTVMPRAMISLEGGYQFGFSTPYNMGVDADTGNSFPQLARDPTIASAASFFNDVFNGAIDESRLILGFPAYGPTIDHWLGQFVNPPPSNPPPNSIGAKIAADLDSSFGRAASQGIRDSSQNTHVFTSFPVPVSGQLTDPNDMAFLNAMHNYMQGHSMNHFVWYCWNGATSTNTGLVDAQTYQTVDRNVLNYLQQLGLTPP